MADVDKQAQVDIPGEPQVMVAYDGLDDPYSEHVEKGETFETSEAQAKIYTRAQWAGPGGVDARDIQLEVAAEEMEDRKFARKIARQGRTVFRNLLPGSADRGNVGAVGVNPGVVGSVGSFEERRTNTQIEDEHTGEGKAITLEDDQRPEGSSDAEEREVREEPGGSQGGGQGGAQNSSQDNDSQEEPVQEEPKRPRTRKGNKS